MLFIPDDHVCLLLVQGEAEEEAEAEDENESEVWFCLDIPLDNIDPLCLTPRKYLLYLGWCILGLDDAACKLGIAGEDGEFHPIDDEGDLEGGGIYLLMLGDPPPDMAVVDIEVIKARTGVSSETTGTRQGFRTQLIERDIDCVFTGLEARHSEGLHIIPFKRGSEWFQLIVENRPHENDDDLAGLNDINDVRNGFLASSTVHPSFDSRILVILKTPNPILAIDDIPPSPVRALGPLGDDVEYPENSRYSAQWLEPPGRHMEVLLPNNTDATFGKASAARKPSALLLHYNYGAAAVKVWGHNTYVLKRHVEGSRPPKPGPISFGPSKQVHDRVLTIEKRRKAMAAAEEAKKASTSKEATRKAASWDEDDVILFFWGNSRAARERYRKKREAKRESLEQWRAGLPTAC